MFATLRPLDPLVGGSASIGDVSVLYDYRIEVVDVGYQHGVTDRLSAGIHVPYYWIKNNVRIAFSAANANVGLHPATGTCCIPIAAGGRALETEDVQDIVSSQFGYRRIGTWRGEGIVDFEFGAKYQYLRGEDWTLAASGGVRIPTGHRDDADDLTDVAYSFGNYALLLRLHADYRLSNLWQAPRARPEGAGPAPGEVVLSATVRHDHMLRDRQLKRIGDTPDQVFTTNREKVSRKLGDRFEIELSGRYQLSGAVQLSALYRFGFRLRDRVSGTQGFRVDSLEENTDSHEHVLVPGASYSTLPAYLQRKFPLPMTLSIGYRDRFACAGPRSGQVNPVLRTRWLVFGLAVVW